MVRAPARQQKSHGLLGFKRSNSNRCAYRHSTDKPRRSGNRIEMCRNMPRTEMQAHEKFDGAKKVPTVGPASEHFCIDFCRGLRVVARALHGMLVDQRV